MENPFAISGPGWLAGFKLIVLALFVTWIYLRVTKQVVFILLIAALGLNGLTALIFLSGKNVGTFGILINALCFTTVLLVINGIVCSKIYYELPKLEFVDKEFMVDPDKGLQLHFTAITAFVVIGAAKLTAGNSFVLIESKGRGLGLDMAAYIIYILLAVAIGYLTQYVIPWDEKKQTFVTGDIKLESIDVFEIKGDIHVGEKVAVPFGFFVAFCLIPYLMRDPAQKSSIDQVGLVALGLVIASVTYIQFFYKKKKKSREE